MTSQRTDRAFGDNAEFKSNDALSYLSLADEFETLTEQYTLPIAKQVIALAMLTPGDRVLDVGCGTGILTRLAAALVGPSGAVTGVDLSDHMLDAARRLASGSSTPAIRYVRGDAEALDFSDASFDSVISLYALRHLPDPQRALQEMYRCQAPGGRCVVAIGSAPSLSSTAALRAGFRRVADRVRSLAGRRRLYATKYLDGMLDEHLGPPRRGEDAPWTRQEVLLQSTVRSMMRRAGYRGVRSTWAGQASTIDTVEHFWKLHVVLSSRARKRIKESEASQIRSLRSAFDLECAQTIEGGGSLVYASGASISVGTRLA